MTRLRLTQLIDRSPEQVFAIIADVSAIARWNPTVTASRQISQGDPGEGTSFEMKVKGFGTVPQTLEEFESNKRARYVPHFRVMSGGHRFMLSPEGAGTRVDHELDMEPKGIFILMTPFMAMMGRKNLHATAAALKKYVESQP